MRRRLVVLPLLVLVVGMGVGMSGCGSDDADRIRQQVEQRAQRIQQEIKARRDRIRKKVQEILGQIEQAIPQAQQTSPRVRSQGDTETGTIPAFLTRVMHDVDDYWTQTLRASDLPAPHVGYDWVPPGQTQITGCGPATDEAAFYCATDDTIYVSQQFASDLWRGVARGLPGETAGVGHAAGDFGVAYVLAHEYGHNIQHELGLFTLRPGTTVEPFELQADCFAGAWGNSVYERGELQAGDVQEAINTALAVGDFDIGNAQHHGTPTQRRAAWLSGFRSGDPSLCQRYVPTG
jgi:predicted metalloprotease